MPLEPITNNETEIILIIDNIDHNTTNKITQAY